MQTTRKTLSVSIMGKSTNGLGQFSGKVGALVFAVSNGEQIVRQYQPIVTNPRSDAQLQQRAKMVLAGKVSSVFPTSLLYTLSGNNRKRRGALISTIVKSASVAKSGDGYTAAIDPAALRFVRGFDAEIVRSGTAGQPTWDPQNATLTIVHNNLAQTQGFEDGDLFLNVMLLIRKDGEYDPVLIVVESEMGVPSMMYTLSAYAAKEYVAHVYIVATRQRQSGITSVSTDGVGGSDESITSTLGLGTGISAIEWTNSYYVGSVDLS